MLNQYKIDIDYKDLENKLGEHKKQMNRIARRMMGAVGSDIKKVTKSSKLKGQVLNKVSGLLQKKMYFKTFKDMTAIIGNRAYYSSWHENGLGGRLPARPFLLPTIEDYFNTTKAEDIMDKILQDALDKIYNAGEK